MHQNFHIFWTDFQVIGPAMPVTLNEMNSNGDVSSLTFSLYFFPKIAKSITAFVCRVEEIGQYNRNDDI